jgi:hypothetical protein
MNTSPITIVLDRSTAYGGLYAEQNGVRVSLELALEQGFYLSREDAPAGLTLLENFVRNRDENQK